MGSGGSKEKQSSGGDVDLVKANGGRERRPSHVDTNPPAKSEVLVPCGSCDRKFAADRIQRHAEVRVMGSQSLVLPKTVANGCLDPQVCSKQKKKQRSVFDVQGQRLEGTEAEEFRDNFSEMEVTR